MSLKRQLACFCQSPLNITWIVTMLRPASKLRWWFNFHPSLRREYEGSRSIRNVADQSKGGVTSALPVLHICPIYISNQNVAVAHSQPQPNCFTFLYFMMNKQRYQVGKGLHSSPGNLQHILSPLSHPTKQSPWCSDQYRLFLSRCCPSTPRRHFEVPQFIVTPCWACL